MAKPTYVQLSDLAADSVFAKRCAFSILKYGQYIADEAADTAFHTSRYRWAIQAVTNPDGVAAPLLKRIAFDPIFSNIDPWVDVASALAAVNDATLQAAVENAVNRTA